MRREAECGAGRIFCVDLLRGLDIFCLLVVFNLVLNGVYRVWPLEGTLAKALFSHSLTAFAAPGHVPTGFGLLDFTQPLFIFVTGVSASLSMRKFVLPGGMDFAAFWKRLAKRTLLLWVLGSLIRRMLTFKLFTGSTPDFCLYSDTLHTIAVAYFAASVGLLLRRAWMRLALGLVFVVGVAAVMATCGDYTQHGNAARLLDEAVYSRLGGRAKDFCYLLTTFTWAGMGILASLAGDVLKGDRAPQTKAKALFGAGFGAAALGGILSIWIPPIRYVYTVSFVFATLGLSALLLAALYVLTDIRQVRRGTDLLILFGRCSLAAWMIVTFFGRALEGAASCLVGEIPAFLGLADCQPVFLGVAKAALLVWAVQAWSRLRMVTK